MKARLQLDAKKANAKASIATEGLSQALKLGSKSQKPYLKITAENRAECTMFPISSPGIKQIASRNTGFIETPPEATSNQEGKIIYCKLLRFLVPLFVC